MIDNGVYFITERDPGDSHMADKDGREYLVFPEGWTQKEQQELMGKAEDPHPDWIIRPFVPLLELFQNYSPPPLRPSFEEIFFRSALLWSQRSTCPRAQVGCVLASPENYMLATGYNGAPAGAKHCLETGCVPDAYGHCARSVHAEMNAIAQAARRGTSLRGASAFLTLKPCLTCAKALIQVGIARVLWLEEYLENTAEAETLEALFLECGVFERGLYKLPGV
jgi:dCMP deaminase